jgi:hypothetical protein
LGIDFLPKSEIEVICMFLLDIQNTENPNLKEMGLYNSTMTISGYFPFLGNILSNDF